MIRTLSATVLALTVACAVAPSWADDLPVPPIPPAASSLLTSAPVPSYDMKGPVGAVDQRPSVAIRFYRNNEFHTGYGFMPGSRYRSTEDSRPFPNPGISVSVPIK